VAERSPVFEWLRQVLAVCMVAAVPATTVFAQQNWQSGSYQPQYGQYPSQSQQPRYQGGGYPQPQGTWQAPYDYTAPVQGAVGQPPPVSGFPQFKQDSGAPQFQQDFGYPQFQQDFGYPQFQQNPGFSQFQQDQQPVPGFGGSSPPQGYVPTPGYRFRDTGKRPEPEVELPRFRPDSLLGKTPYGWGGAPDTWSQGGMAPAPVFRPLDEADRERARKQTEGRRYDGGYGGQGYPAPGYGYGSP